MVVPVVMYGCESWTVKKAECQRIDAFELWCWRRQRLAFDEPKYCRFVHRSMEEWNLFVKLRLRREQKVFSKGIKAEENSGEKKSIRNQNRKTAEAHWSNLTLFLLQCYSHWAYGLPHAIPWFLLPVHLIRTGCSSKSEYLPHQFV